MLFNIRPLRHIVNYILIVKMVKYSAPDPLDDKMIQRTCLVCQNLQQFKEKESMEVINVQLGQQ